MTARRARWLSPAAGLISLAVVGAACLGWVATASRAAARIDQWTESQAEAVQSSVEDAIAGVVADLEAVAAYLEAGDVSQTEFARFVDRVDGTRAAVGVGYAVQVAREDVDAHVAEMRAELFSSYDIVAMDETGSLFPIDLDDRDFLYPVLRFAAGDAVLPFVLDVPTEHLGIGLDAAYDPEWRDALAAAFAAGGPWVSESFSIDIDDVPLARMFFVTLPVSGSDGEAVGLVAAVMLEPLLLASIGQRTTRGSEWEIVPGGEAPIRIDAEDARRFPLEVPGADWSVVIALTEEVRADLAGFPPWGPAVGVGLLAGFAGITALLLVERRSKRREAEDLRRAADDKDRFLATVSHELRTPLTAVSGLAHEFRDRDGDFEGEEREVMLSMMVEQSDELAGIVEDLLIAARSDIDKVVIHHERVDLADETRRAMDTAGVDLPVFGEAGPAWADSQRVRQIMRNLLSNARRYGGNDVRIEVASIGDEVSIAVADNGAPIPPPDRIRIFESYTSAHRQTRSIESVGLGLFISKRLALAMGGDLHYRHDGEWSRFVVTLPAAAVADETGPVAARTSA